MVKDKYNANNTFILAIFLFYILTMIAGFRPIGFDNDSIGYFQLMKNIIDDKNDFPVEISFIWIVKSYYYLFGNDYYQRFTLFTFSLINIVLIALALKKLSKKLLFTIFIYTVLFYPILTLTQIRFGIASAIFLFAIDNIYEKRLFSYLIKIVAASMFHISAIILIPVYFLNINKINKFFYIYLFIFSIIIPFINDSFIHIVLYYLDYFPNFIATKVYTYLHFYTEGSSLSSINIFNTFSLFIMGIYLFSLYNIEKYKSKYAITLVKILGWGIFLYTASSFFPTLSIRILNVFGLVSIILLAESMYLFTHTTIIYTFICFMLLLIFFNINIRHELLNFGIYYE